MYGLAVAPEDPTIEMLVEVMGCELSMRGVGHVAAEDARHTRIVLQWRDQIHQPHAIGWESILSEKSDILTC